MVKGSIYDWIKICQITLNFILNEPTILIYTHYMNFCNYQQQEAEGKKIFYREIKRIFYLSPVIKQKSNGYRYFQLWNDIKIK